MVDETFMRKALRSAWEYQGLTYPNPPVGAVIVDKNQKIISVGVHKKAGDFHAELDAVYKALLFYKKDVLKSDASTTHKFIRENYPNFFKEHTIYVTLEPCNHYGKTPPCSLLLKDMGFERVVISCLDINKEASGGVEFLEKSMEVKVGVLEDEGKKLLKFFEMWQSKKPFIFFKVAVSKNSVYTGGVISSKTSRELVHRIREVCDLLVIGGESVRVDRPTLDTRLSSGKNPPDILILSKRDDFDRDIPLFSVEGREVFINDSLDILKNYEFIMIEGGENLYNFVKKKIDAIMIFQSSYEKEGRAFEFGKDLKRLKKFNYFDDTIEWKVKELS
jgi:diaminohydroxyphosphoribosylaminopyrimidine deaminase/5-amino-6-(5-phosphoribosylamino)uracil reductase